MSASDVVCAHWLSWMTKGDPYRKPFLQQRRAGKQLWFYNVPPLSDVGCLLDPYSGYLLRGWHCYDQGANGSGFWGFTVLVLEAQSLASQTFRGRRRGRERDCLDGAGSLLSSHRHRQGG